MKTSLTNHQSEILRGVIQYALDNFPAEKIVWNKSKKKNELVYRDGYDEFRADASKMLCALTGIEIKPTSVKPITLKEIFEMPPKKREKVLAALGTRTIEEFSSETDAIEQTAQALQTK